MVAGAQADSKLVCANGGADFGVVAQEPEIHESRAVWPGM